MSESAITPDTAVIGIVIASSVNNMVKATMAWFIGPHALGRRVAGPMGLSLLVGLTAGWMI